MNFIRIRSSIFILLLSFIVQFGRAQETKDPITDTEISILTCRSGDELYTTFGHTAIRVNNPRLKLDQVYNYGLFSFNTPNFYIKFMRGQLPYLLGRVSMKYFLEEYNFEKRSVFEQVLNINDLEKKEIIRFLEVNAKPENREYAYDFFYDNCGTRVVDVYGMAGERITYDNKIEEKTFRDILKENLRSLPWSDFGIDLVIGQRADRKTNRRHQMFLPENIMINLSSAFVVNQDTTYRLAQDPYLVLDFEELNEARKTASLPIPLIVMSLVFMLILWINRKGATYSQRSNKFLLILAGAFGVFLLFMWFGTNHGATRDNWNVLWLNPLLVFYALIPSSRNIFLKYFLLLLLLIASLNCCVTFLPQFFNFAFLPIILGIGRAVWNLRHKATFASSPSS